MELVFRSFGDRVSGEYAGSILYLLSLERVNEVLNVARRLNLPGLTAYVESQLDDLDWFILELNKLARPTLYHSDRRAKIATLINDSLYEHDSDVDAIYRISRNLSWQMEVDINSNRGHQLIDLVTEWLPKLRAM